MTFYFQRKISLFCGFFLEDNEEEDEEDEYEEV